MPLDPTALRPTGPSPLLPGAGVPARLPLGPNSRYAEMSGADLVAVIRALESAVQLWCGQAQRFRAVGVTTALGGPCADALLQARSALLAEVDALVQTVRLRSDEVRRALALQVATRSAP